MTDHAPTGVSGRRRERWWRRRA